jgi:hypothetical protein
VEDSALRDLSAPWGALYEADANQIRLNNRLDGVRLFTDSNRKSAKTNGLRGKLGG